MAQSARDHRPAAKPVVVEMPVPADATEEPVVAIWVDHRYAMIRKPGFDRRTPGAIILAWKDGQMIWSADPVRGGPPYRRGRADAAGIERMLADLADQDLFAEGGFIWRHAAFDASYTVIGIADGKRRLHMENWRELVEHPNLVTTAEGVTVLDDRPQDDTLARLPERDRRPRQIWAHIRRSLNDLIPGPGEPAGDIELELWKIRPPNND